MVLLMLFIPFRNHINGPTVCKFLHVMPMDYANWLLLLTLTQAMYWEFCFFSLNPFKNHLNASNVSDIHEALDLSLDFQGHGNLHVKGQLWLQQLSEL